MTIRHFLHDAGHCLRAAAAPLLALSVLALARTMQGEAPPPGGVAELVGVAWRAAVLGPVLWFLVAVILAATRPWRDLRAFRRLQRLREIAAQPNRALVFVQTIVWGTAAGQHAVVVNLATGTSHGAWLPESTLKIGSFVVLERTESGVRVVDCMDAQHVEGGHRHEQRHVAHGHSSGERVGELPEHGQDDALLLIEETERFLRGQESI